AIRSPPHHLLVWLVFFFFNCYGALRHLHSFPTRRSSDLILPTLFDAEVRAVRAAALPGAPACVLLDLGEGRSAQLSLGPGERRLDRKSTRLNSSHVEISYAVFCLKKKKKRGPTRCAQRPT